MLIQPNQYNAALISNLESCNSVGIHVRRGDYLAEPEFRGICGLDYYEKGIKEILSDEKKYVFFIFSNDMQWCQENIAPLVGDNRIVFILIALYLYQAIKVRIAVGICS